MATSNESSKSNQNWGRLEAVSTYRPEASIPRHILTSVGLFFALSFLVAIAATLIHGGPHLSKQRMVQILKEASGNEPLPQSGDDLTRALRKSFREIFTFRKQTEAAGRSFQTPEIAHLLELVSFSSKETVEETLRQLVRMKQYDLNLAQASSLIRQHLRETESTLSDRDASAFRPLEQNFEKSSAFQAEVLAKEERFLASAINLYDLTLRNFSKFSLKGDRLLIADEETRKQYSAQRAMVQQYARESEKANRQLQVKQDEALQHVGLSRSELGI